MRNADFFTLFYFHFFLLSSLWGGLKIIATMACLNLFFKSFLFFFGLFGNSFGSLFTYKMKIIIYFCCFLGAIWLEFCYFSLLVREKWEFALKCKIKKKTFKRTAVKKKNRAMQLLYLIIFYLIRSIFGEKMNFSIDFPRVTWGRYSGKIVCFFFMFFFVVFELFFLIFICFFLVVIALFYKYYIFKIMHYIINIIEITYA